MRIAQSALLALMVSALLGCGSTQVPAKTVAESSPARRAYVWASKVDPARTAEAFRFVMDHAPRPAGSESMSRFRGDLASRLSSMGFTVKEEPFTARGPRGEMRLVNLVAERKGTVPGILYLASHIDTKQIPGITFLGANDSGSSTAALLEAARVLSGQPARHTVRLLFLDGEEAFGESITSEDGLYGSRFHARNLRAAGEVAQVRAFVLLDMMGDVDLSLVQDGNSDPGLLSLFASCCSQLGDQDLMGGSSMEVIDDHVPFKSAGIPVLDLIDFEYGPGNSFWHTAQDTPGNVSVANISRVLRATLALLEEVDGGK